MIWAAVCAMINLGLGATLFFTPSSIGGFVGLALATSVAAWVNVIALWVILTRDQHVSLDGRLKGRLPRILISAALMGAALWWAAPKGQALLNGSMLNDYMWLLVICGAGAGVYGIVALVTGAVKPADLKASFAKPSLAKPTANGFERNNDSENI